MEILKDKVIYLAVVIGVVINLVLPFVLKRFATSDEISPPNGPSKLSLKEQVMHMFVHHAQVPVSSSIIVGIIVFLSVLLAKICCKKFLEKKE